jgi:hypothetical protein
MCMSDHHKLLQHPALSQPGQGPSLGVTVWSASSVPYAPAYLNLDNQVFFLFFFLGNSESLLRVLFSERAERSVNPPGSLHATHETRTRKCQTRTRNCCPSLSARSPFTQHTPPFYLDSPFYSGKPMPDGALYQDHSWVPTQYQLNELILSNHDWSRMKV